MTHADTQREAPITGSAPGGRVALVTGATSLSLIHI